ncbi:MAG: tRNA (adenosine(37)-N6)-threonylcarbamoyltransferase complex ATPase subunit type 1 TsaE [Bacteroidales bacterium]|nr:tRNA (adenosine(37)-N6)-threonylcarbamoyltransferase complex ATPase subunit type 1 TsaE [Bacteroidales bacterium]
MVEIICKDKIELHQVARSLLETFANDRFFAFFGNMGVGKTTLIKEICAMLGVTDNVCSPTFSIVNEYVGSDGMSIFHFDFYRLKNIEETYDMGYEEYFYSGNYCFVEWSEKVETLLPDTYIRIDIVEEGNGVRKFMAKRIVT